MGRSVPVCRVCCEPDFPWAGCGCDDNSSVSGADCDGAVSAEPAFSGQEETDIPLSESMKEDVRLPAAIESLRNEPWFADVCISLFSYCFLEPGWNGYEESRIAESAIADTLVVLARTALGGPAPWAVPKHDGGIQIEWYYGDAEIEVGIPPSGPASVYIETSGGGENYYTALVDDEEAWKELAAAITDLPAQKA